MEAGRHPETNINPQDVTRLRRVYILRDEKNNLLKAELFLSVIYRIG